MIEHIHSSNLLLKVLTHDLTSREIGAVFQKSTDRRLQHAKSVPPTGIVFKQYPPYLKLQQALQDFAFLRESSLKFTRIFV